MAEAHLKHIGHGVKNGQEGMLLVEAFGLAGGAQVIIGTRGALEASANHLSLTTITSHTRVNHGLVMRRWAHVGWAHVGWAHRRVSWRSHVERVEGNPLVHMMWEITLVFLFF